MQEKVSNLASVGQDCDSWADFCESESDEKTACLTHGTLEYRQGFILIYLAVMAKVEKTICTGR